MLYLLAILLPFAAVFLCGRIITGILLLVLQLTVLGWLPAAIVACLIVSDHKADKRSKRRAQ